MINDAGNANTPVWYQLIRKELNVFAGISFGVFLFILFFQPFNLDKFDFNNRLLFIAGLGGIVFILIALTHILFLRAIQSRIQNRKEASWPVYVSGVFLLIMNTVAFAFYIRYVGSVPLTIYIVFKIFILSLAPPLILNFFYVFRNLKEQFQHQQLNINQLQKQLAQHSRQDTKSSIEFVSLNSNDKLIIFEADVVMIRSADNYVEIIYTTEQGIRKKMLRNTLKNIEYQVHKHANFLRCHRTSIINLDYAERLRKRYNSYLIDLKGMDEGIPVSRQYLMRVKEAVTSQRGE